MIGPMLRRVPRLVAYALPAGAVIYGSGAVIEFWRDAPYRRTLWFC